VVILMYNAVNLVLSAPSISLLNQCFDIFEKKVVNVVSLLCCGSGMAASCLVISRIQRIILQKTIVCRKFRPRCIEEHNCGESNQTTKQNLFFRDISCVCVCVCVCWPRFQILYNQHSVPFISPPVLQTSTMLGFDQKLKPYSLILILTTCINCFVNSATIQVTKNIQD
jgi:hypothetical protein